MATLRALACGTAVAVLTMLALLAAQPALAGSTGSAALGCPGQTFGRPFMPWLDVLAYTQVPNGGLEAGAQGWRLAGGAKVVSGNEPFFVSSSSDRSSLFLPAGSSATTPPICVGLGHPTLRFFAAKQGALLATLSVDLVYTTTSGRTLAVPMGLVLGGAAWSPTLPLVSLGGVLGAASLDGLTTKVSFRLTPRAGLLGATASWRVDDLYVDPLWQE